MKPGDARDGATEGIRDFFDGWALYDHVLDRNYMFHDEIFRDVRRILQERQAGRPFALLDLGCGSARHIAAALTGTSVNHYAGCDLSDVALGHARRQFLGHSCRCEFIQRDFVQVLEEGRPEFDVIFSAYALHHLTTDRKAEFFHLVRRRLREGGMLLLVDTIQEEHESRESSIAAYCSWVGATWGTVPPEVQHSIFEHIRGFDHPEKSSTIHRLAAEAGFERGTDVNHHRWHRTWCFEK